MRRSKPRADTSLRPRQGKVRPVLVRHLAIEEIARAESAVVAYETAAVNPETLHRFRAACRRLRYLLELIRDGQDAPSSASNIIDELKTVQTVIGDLHDHHVAIERISKWLARGDLRRTPELEHYLVERTRKARQLLAQADEQRRKILSPRFRTRLATLLG